MPLIYHAITDKGIGGAGLFLLRLLTHTDKERFPSRVLLPKGSALIPLFDRYSIPTISLSEAKEASFSFPFFMALCRYLRRYPPDLLHAHGALSAKLSARLTTSAPILATRHCDTPFPSSALALSLYRRLTDATVSPSVVGLARLKERLPEERLYAVPNGYLPQGLPSLTERKEARQLFGVKEGDIAVGLCGRLAKVKGHEVLLLAAKDVLAKEGRFLFLLLGEGEERRALEALALSLGIADRVRFLGHREVVAPFYHALDIHLSASLSDETASLALAEGMSAGVATVASDCPGNRERVKDGGLFFPAGNAPLLAALLLSLREEEKRRPLSLLALERAKHLPSFAETAEAYSSIYLTLLKEKAQKGS